MPLIDLAGLVHFKDKENEMIAADYSATKTYAVGDYVYYNGVLKRCTTAITTAEAYTAAHWTNAVLAGDVTELKTALTGYCILDFSNAVSGYLSSKTIGDPVRTISSTVTTTVKRICPVKQGYIYRISIEEGSTLANASNRDLVLANNNDVIFQADLYFTTAGQTEIIEFTAFNDGFLTISLDNNYQSITIEGSPVFQSQKISENTDYKVVYLAETGRLIVIRETIRASRYATKYFNIPAGTYHFHCDSVVSDDTSASTCLVNLGGGSTAFQIARGVAVDVEVTLTSTSNKQYFYSSDNASHSYGKDAEFKNVIISKAAYSAMNSALIDENSAWSN